MNPEPTVPEAIALSQAILDLSGKIQQDVVGKDVSTLAQHMMQRGELIKQLQSVVSQSDFKTWSPSEQKQVQEAIDTVSAGEPELQAQLAELKQQIGGQLKSVVTEKKMAGKYRLPSQQNQSTRSQNV